nr:DegT/DnrJ/EryC1/StrS family aminotransferase [Candidatus Sigynarchaeota archaeon]
MKVPIIKIEVGDAAIAEALDVLKSGMWAEGKNVHALEEEFAKYIGVKHARAVNNGTAALLCALDAANIKPGDEVLVPSFTFIASVNTILSFGAKPVFVDIDFATFNMSVDDARKKVTPKTKAIMPVHLYGLSVDMDPLNELASTKGIKVIEDACQAHGASYKGKKCGSLGDVGAFSLYPTKNMVCGGEGGLVTTNDDEAMARLKLYANHGQSQKYMHSSIGYNYRMQEINAVVARHSLKALDANNKKRQENAGIYTKGLSGIDGIEVPFVPASCVHVFHQYTLKVKNRESLLERLQKNDIGYGIHYGIPAHMQESVKALGFKVSLPHTEQVAKEVVSLPVHPLLSKDQIEFVMSVINA